MEQVMMDQRTTEVKSYETLSKKNSENLSLTQEEVIDLILQRHIRVIKFSNNLASKINLEFLGFRNELVSDLLIDKESSIFLDSVSRIDKFLEKMHVKFHQLKEFSLF